MRALTGVSCGVERGFRFRWFVLTESDEALAAGANFSKEFHRFLTWLKKKCGGIFEYIVVEHRQGKPSKITGQQRRNWHILSYGSDRLPVKEMRAYWIKHYQSTLTGMAEVVDINKSVRYLCGYLAGAEKFVTGESKFVRCWMSHGWVWPGWLPTTKNYKRVWDKYMDRADIAWLSTLTPDQRAIEVAWALSEDFE